MSTSVVSEIIVYMAVNRWHLDIKRTGLFIIVLSFRTVTTNLVVHFQMCFLVTAPVQLVLFVLLHKLELKTA